MELWHIIAKAISAAEKWKSILLILLSTCQKLLRKKCGNTYAYVIFTFCSSFCDKYSILTPANVRMVNIERRKLLSNQDARSQVFFVLFVFWNSFLHIILLYSLKPNAYITCFASGIIFSWEVNECMCTKPAT